MNEKRDVLLNFKSRLDSVVKYDTNNNPYWSARDLQEILGYVEWRKFNLVIQRAIKTCNMSGYDPNDHFINSNKSVITGNNAVRIINDYYLTSYACILICRNGNPAKKEGIAYAQAYFSLFDYKYSLEI